MISKTIGFRGLAYFQTNPYRICTFWSLCLIGCSPLLGRALGPFSNFQNSGHPWASAMMTNLGRSGENAKAKGTRPGLMGAQQKSAESLDILGHHKGLLFELPNLNGRPSKSGWLCGPCSQRLDSIHQSFDALVSLQIHSNINLRLARLARLAQILFDIWTMAKL